MIGQSIPVDVIIKEKGEKFQSIEKQIWHHVMVPNLPKKFRFISFFLIIVFHFVHLFSTKCTHLLDII